MGYKFFLNPFVFFLNLKKTEKNLKSRNKNNPSHFFFLCVSQKLNVTCQEYMFYFLFIIIISNKKKEFLKIKNIEYSQISNIFVESH